MNERTAHRENGTGSPELYLTQKDFALPRMLEHVRQSLEPCGDFQPKVRFIRIYTIAQTHPRAN
ncbi:MAG: hypothetical protein KGQ60_08660 [Planctomycetes bacterium]|nr:hypothetical protein [Planctomycetota bacterium]